MEKIEIFGITTDRRFDDWKEKFELSYENDDETLYVSKETFHHNEDDGFDFDYKYCVQFTDFSEFDEEGGIGYQLIMVVMPMSLHKGNLEKLCKEYGIASNEIDIRCCIDDLTAYVKFGEGECEKWEDVDGILLRIAHVFGFMDRMRGFFLDKPWNRIGSTGWDTLSYAIKGTDIFQPAIDRYRDKF